jgi:HK97 family phage prohead protease
VITIVDLDGTLILDNEQPNQPLIDLLNDQVMSGDTQIIIVSARSIERLEETRAWLQEYKVAGVEEVHLNDFDGTPFATGFAFKEYKYGLLREQYGAELEMAIDNDPAVREMAEKLGIMAHSPEDYLAMENRAPVAGRDKFTTREEALERAEQIGCEGAHSMDENGQTIYMPCRTHAAYDAIVNTDTSAPGYRAVYEVPEYIREAARKGLEWHEQGLSGDGLQPQTVAEARELAAGRVDTDKVVRMAAWTRRHRTDWEGVPQNSDRTNEDFPGPGAVAGFLWGVETTDPEGADRVISWADRLIASEDREIVDMKEKEVRSLPIGEFRLGEAGEDGQRTFSGYAAIWNSASEGLPFEERIAPNAFKRSLARATAGQKIIAFLFGHDETRALATTASGRLQLNEDETGLRVEAKLDPADPDAAKVISMLTHESAAAGMSFGFQKVQDSWDGNNRTIKEANLFEVSILAAGGQTPAYPATLGLTAIRQVTAPKIGVEAEALMATLEAVKAGRELSSEELAVIDAVRSKLAPKQEKVIDPSVAAALLTLESAEGDAL